MADFKVAYINPEAALGPLTPNVLVGKVADLGPSAPHTDAEPIEIAAVDTQLNAGPNFGPGAPPIVGGAAAEKHYTQVLDEIWPKYDDAEERTADRLGALLDEVADEAQRVHILAQETWPKMPWFKVPELERKRYDAEFLAYLRRLNSYRGLLRTLEPDSTDTGSVYVGLVKRAQATGPVPDCIMHLYFANQLGILAEHSQDMGEGFVGRFMDALAAVDRKIDDAAAEVDEAKRDAKEGIAGAWAGVTRTAKIVIGVVLGSVVVLTGVVVVDRMLGRSQQKPQEPAT